MSRLVIDIIPKQTKLESNDFSGRKHSPWDDLWKRKTPPLLSGMVSQSYLTHQKLERNSSLQDTCDWFPELGGFHTCPQTVTPSGNDAPAWEAGIGLGPASPWESQPLLWDRTTPQATRRRKDESHCYAPKRTLLPFSPNGSKDWPALTDVELNNSYKMINHSIRQTQLSSSIQENLSFSRSKTGSF